MDKLQIPPLPTHEATRASLVKRLRNLQDERSWIEFFDRYWRLIFAVALRSGLNPTDAEDVVQETIVSVVEQMPTFHYDPAKGSFKSWLYQITRRRIADHLRSAESIQSARPREDTDTARMEKVPDPNQPESCWDVEWQNNLLEVAMNKVKAAVNPIHFQIFDLYVMKEWEISQVQKVLGVNRTQIYLAKHRVSGLIQKEARKLASVLEKYPA